VLTSNVDLADPQEMAKFKYALEYVEGIGRVYAERLKAIGLITCLDLLQAGATRKGREETAEKSGISPKLILEWVNHIDLYRIKGVGSEYADLLEAAGVDTVMELAQRNPGNLLAAMDRVNADKNLVRKMPTSNQVGDWVSQAKTLPRVIRY
jgi:predicted flap endonuclease-1-like 5' DNA nuclease